MTSVELRQKYLKFFQGRDHKIIPSASLIPSEEVELAGTERVLFTTAGMHPLIPYLMGKSHSEGTRLVNVQKCLRTDDIDEVGDAVHNTFFEMLGNWSLGDYWKEEAITWSYEFMVNELKLDSKRIYVSVFAGDNDAPFDQQSYDTWIKVGIPEDHIFKYGKEDNWWPTGGEKPGPQGPDTEMFYDLDPRSKSPIDPSANSQRFVEIWNDVFMEYERQADGSYTPLKQRNVDTGMGLERMLTVLQKAPSIYETDVFLPLMKKIEDMTDFFSDSSARIVADHIRAAVFLISDGVSPSNVERGYILRRLIRRTIRHASLLKIDQNFLSEFSKVVIKTYENIYPDLVEHQQLISTELQKEEQKFKNALAQGLKNFEKISGNISGQQAFDLYQNFGFPIELTAELAKEKNKKVDLNDFEKLLKVHQNLSKSQSQKTKGGLAVQSDIAARYHTATHLMHQALRDELGSHVHQTGSHITNERLRFDFSHDAKLTDQQIQKVEKIVNEKIKKNLPVHKKSLPKEIADEIGAIGLFREKYGDLVNIYYIGESDDPKIAYSKEFCGGPHAKSTGEIGDFKIIKEESAGSGIRRIYATIKS